MKIINSLPAIQPELETKKIIDFIREVYRKAKKKTALIALSGGIDSSTAAFLATKALGPKNVHTLVLPSLQSTAKNTEDGNLVAEMLEIPRDQIHEINLAAAQEAVAKTLDLFQVNRPQSQVEARIGNIAARLRMIFLFDQAKALDALVMGTENKSEHLLGYYTRFGDEASDIEPIKHLYKTQVFALATHLNIPQEIIDKSPSADLWPEQTDEAELGFGYTLADPMLYEHFDNNISQTELIKLGYPKDLVQKIFNHIKSIQFKHLVPYSL